MKFFKKSPVFLLLCVSAVFVSTCGFLGKDNIYQEFQSSSPAPSISIVMEGALHNVMPWDYFSYKEITEEKIASDINTVISDAGTQGTIIATEEPTIHSPIISDNTSIPLSSNTIPSTPAFEYTTVSENYLDDALFIGDSRTKGLSLYSGWKNTTYFCETGLTVYSVFDSKFPQPGIPSKKCKLEGALCTTKYSKIYIMLGINELGRGTPEDFYETYEHMVGRIRELQPDAVFFIQAIIHVSEKKEAEGTYINNAAITERNALISTLANDQNIFFLDANEVLCDENGYLIEDYTFDGVHLEAAKYDPWKEFILSHGIIK